MGIGMDDSMRIIFMDNDLMRNKLAFRDSIVAGLGSGNYPRKSWFLSVLVTFSEIISQVFNNQLLAIIPAQPWSENCRKPLQNRPCFWRLGGS
jgi:hypothetical protein